MHNNNRQRHERAKIMKIGRCRALTQGTLNIFNREAEPALHHASKCEASQEPCKHKMIQ